MLSRKHVVVLMLVSLLLWNGCKKDNAVVADTTEVDNAKLIELQVYPKFGSVPLTLNTKFVTVAGDSVLFSAIRFYVSEPALVDSQGHEIALEDTDAVAKVAHGSGLAVWLVDMSATSIAARGYYSIFVKGDPGKYRGIKFNLGVPFAENHKDVSTQGYPLGPDVGMYWGWNPGYIFQLIEGKTDQQFTQDSSLTNPWRP